MSDDAKPDENAGEDLAEGTLLSHLVELRSRLIKAAIAVGIVFVGLVFVMTELFELVAEPLAAALPGGKLIALEPLSTLIAQLKLVFLTSLLIAMPVVLYQAWAFIAPGLYRKEKRFAFPLLASSIGLFYAGAAFAYFVLFPLIFNFVVQMAPANVEVQTDISAYVGFVSTIVLVFGLAFEVPVATVLLVWTGLVSRKKIARARPYVFLMAFVIGMFLTPPDVFSQTLLAVPVYLLYEIGLFMSRFFEGGREKAAGEEDEAVATDG